MEFVKAMKIKRRICDFHERECDKCPLSSNNNHKDLDCFGLMQDHPKKAEQILSEWEKKHPIKTNLDVFCETFGFEKEDVDIYECIFCCNGETRCNECKNYGFWEKEYKK